LLSSAIYALPTLQGNLMMLPNEDDADTPINLELLFGAVLEHPERVAEMFHPEKKNAL
jgi:ABC-2 type transport system ATP-binding protein